VVMPDARGHGLSGRPWITLGLDDLAADLAGLIEALSLERPVVIGHSMGGLTVGYLAAYYPEVPRAIVMEDPPFVAVQDRPLAERKEWAERMREGAAQSKATPRQELLERCRRQCPTWTEGEIQCWADAKPHVNADVGSLVTTPTRLPWREALAQVTCPALLFRPDPDKGYTTAEHAQEMQRLMPGLEVAHIPGTGHCIRREQPAEYLRIVREFLARV
jgi:N-formylmaleamate deformylase